MNNTKFHTHLCFAPTPYRGQRNESANIPIIAQKVADIFETSIERVAEVTSANVERIFRI